MGGPVSCVDCEDYLELMPVAPREFCALRAAGKHRSACELRFDKDPSKCARLVDE
jgi:hypothetical protein